MNLTWWLERAYWEHPDKVAVIDADGGSARYREMRGLANRISNVLAAHASIGEDDVVVTVMPDNYLHVATLFCPLGLLQTDRSGGKWPKLKHEEEGPDRAKHTRSLAPLPRRAKAVARLKAGGAPLH